MVFPSSYSSLAKTHRETMQTCLRFTLPLILSTALISPAWAQCLQPPPVTPPIDSTVLPLPLLGTGLYQGMRGGLYPDGKNTPPASHRDAQVDAARRIVPSGLDGLIGLLAVGFSNPSQEFGAFSHRENESTDRNARVVLINGPEGGQSVDSTILVDENRNNDYWANIAGKVEAAGLTPDQVRVAWIKTTTKDHDDDLQADATLFKDKLITLMQLLKFHYPKVEIAYVSSRIYSGYASPIATEPADYEEGFAHRLLIEEQIDGNNPGLDYTNGTVPLILWGPYLWANGEWQPYQGLIWCPEDYEEEGTNRHLNERGEEKVVQALTDFFATDRLTRRWWEKQPDRALSPFTSLRDTYVLNDEALGCLLPDFGDRPYMATTINDVNKKHAYVTFDISSETRPIIRAFLGLRVIPDELNADGEKVSTIKTTVSVVTEADEDWQENGFTWCTQPSVLETPTFRTAKGHPRGAYVSLDVTEALAHDTNGLLSFRIVADSTRLSTVANSYMTRDDDPLLEHQFPPQLILLVDDTGASCPLGRCRREAPSVAVQTDPVSLSTYPNPFNPTTTIQVTLPRNAPVRVAVYDVMGRRVARLREGPMKAGRHLIPFDGSALASGVYFVRVNTPGGTSQQRLILQK